MLAIQPVSLNNCHQNVSFQQRKKKAFEDEKAFYEQQKQEIEGLLSDERLPKGMKKFLKAANIITDGLISGFTVACATIASAACGKNVYQKLSKNKIVQNIVKGVKPFAEYLSKGIKKLFQYAGKLVRKVFGQEKGQAVVDASKKIIEKTDKAFKNMNPFKNVETYDKAAAKTATGLGVGAGLASAYAKTVEKSEQDGEV